MTPFRFLSVLIALMASNSIRADDTSYYICEGKVMDGAAPGWIAFEANYPDDVSYGKRDAGARIPYTADLMNKLKQVNADVNQSIQYDTPTVDEAQEKWHVLPNGGTGNCHDYVATKMDRLVKLGYSPAAFAPADVIGHGRHAVLIVRTDHGDWVLDSEVDAIRSVNDTRYRWLSHLSNVKGDLQDTWREVKDTGCSKPDSP